MRKRKTDERKDLLTGAGGISASCPTNKKQVEYGVSDSGVMVLVGERAEKFLPCDLQMDFLSDLTAQAYFRRFTGIHKPADSPQQSFTRVFGTPDEQDIAIFLDDEGRGRNGGIEIKFQPATAAEEGDGRFGGGGGSPTTRAILAQFERLHRVESLKSAWAHRNSSSRLFQNNRLRYARSAEILSAMAEQIIATEADVTEGKVITFGYRQDGIRREGILLRTKAGLRCYENLCRHLPVKLDSGTRQFLSREKKLILCQSHGALYEPETGLCTRGPCEGASLNVLPVEMREGKVYLLVTDEIN